VVGGDAALRERVAVAGMFDVADQGRGSEAGEIRVRESKGGRPRVTVLSAPVRKPLRRHLAAVRRQHEEDVARGAGSVALPGALAVKYPGAKREWAWQWVFPATRHHVDRASGERRRHHVHESAIQRALKAAGASKRHR